MRESILRMNMLQINDYEGMTRYLENMARKGYLLSEIGKFFWKFKSIEPQSLKFEVTYFKEASDFNPYPTDNQLIFREYCESSGWHFAAEMGVLQIFWSELEQATPIETDEALKLKAIHEAMKRSLIPSQLILFFVAILQTLLQVSSIRRMPIIALSHGLGVVAGLTWICLGLSTLLNLGSYFLWYKRSQASVQRGGTCDSRTNAYRKINFGLMLLTGILLMITFLQLWQMDGVWIGITSFLVIILGVLSGITAQKMLKKRGVQRKTNRILTIATVIVTMMILFAIQGKLIFGHIAIGAYESTPFKQVNKTMPDGSTHTWDIYADVLPLTIEMLKSTDYYDYSYEREIQESIFLKRTTCRQNALPSFVDSDAQYANELDYTIIDLKMPKLKHWILESIVGEKTDWLLHDTAYKVVDTEPWPADAAYVLMQDGEATNQFVLNWDNRIVILNMDWTPTEAQKLKIASTFKALTP